MPPNDSNDARKPPSSNAPNSSSSSSSSSNANAATPRRPAFTVPAPIKHLFSKFPLLTYPPNSLPLRAPPQYRRKHILYVFTSAELAAANAPSYNPGCLKWQTLLKFHGTDFITTPSSNHASPTGALPFLLPASSASNTPSGSVNAPKPNQVIAASKLSSWLKTQSTPAKTTTLAPSTSRLAAYTSLLSPIRLAYLHALYLHDPTFNDLARSLYITPCSANILVQAALAIPLKTAALGQILNEAGGVGVPVQTVDVEALYVRAEEAFEALGALLGDCTWFSECEGWEEAAEEENEQEKEEEAERNEDQEKRSKRKRKHQPHLTDSSIFAYTHVILSLFAGQAADTPAARVYRALEAQRNLVEHRERILREYYEDDKSS